MSALKFFSGLFGEILLLFSFDLCVCLNSFLRISHFLPFGHLLSFEVLRECLTEESPSNCSLS